MPVKSAKRTIKSASKRIRKHWSKDESNRRRETAALMQQQLVCALGLRPTAPR